MKFIISREKLLYALQNVYGVVEKRQSLPILSNVLLALENEHLSITATDMEVELVSRVAISAAELTGETTIPARKLLSICKALPQDSEIHFSAKDRRASIRSGRSRFNLSTLDALDFPGTEALSQIVKLVVQPGSLKKLLDMTQFAMAHDDVRYYLNGLLLELDGDTLRLVATDGHRLAKGELQLEQLVEGEFRQAIVPRKAVVELGRLLTEGNETVELAVGGQSLQLAVGEVRFTTKLVDGQYPDYRGVIPDLEDNQRILEADRADLRQGLARAAILSNEKYRTVRLALGAGELTVVANNPEQEEAEEVIDVDYSAEAMEIGFNVTYLLDVLAAIPSERVRFYFGEADRSCLIRGLDVDDCEYVVMPIRL